MMPLLNNLPRPRAGAALSRGGDLRLAARPRPLVAPRRRPLPLLLPWERRLLLAVGVLLVLWSGIYGRVQFPFLVWNLFLAWLPLAVLRVTDSAAGLLPHFFLRGPGRWLRWVAWLLLLPNAPYIVTDFVHVWHRLEEGRLAGTALAALSVAGSAVLGLAWFARAMAAAEEALARTVLSRGVRRAVLVGVVLATAFGVWLGRVLRFNSWDVVAAPGRLLRESVAFALEPMVMELTLVTAVGLWGVYVVGAWWRDTV